MRGSPTNPKLVASLGQKTGRSTLRSAGSSSSCSAVWRCTSPRCSNRSACWDPCSSTGKVQIPKLWECLDLFWLFETPPLVQSAGRVCLKAVCLQAESPAGPAEWTVGPRTAQTSPSWRTRLPPTLTVLSCAGWWPLTSKTSRSRWNLMEFRYLTDFSKRMNHFY